MTIRALVLAVTVTLLALGGIAGSSSAVASCGDWLAHSQQSDAHRASMYSESEPAAAVVRTAEEDKGTSPRKPCIGPYCRKAPKYPANPTTPAISPAAPESGLLGSSAALRSYTLPDSVTSALEARPAKGYPSRIDHPPRA